MIDSTMGQPVPCPMCASTNVRWRGRRMYDYVLTYLRWSVEAGLRLIGVGRIDPRTPVGRQDRMADFGYPVGAPFSRTPDMMDEVDLNGRDAQVRDQYSTRANLAVAQQYWKCRSCGERGQVFKNMAERLDTR